MNKNVTVFIQVKDRGFHLRVPADQEQYYIRARDSFKRIVEKYKAKGHDDIEAIALTSIDSIVSLQRNYDQLEKQKQQLAEMVASWDKKLEKSLSS